MEGHIFIYGEIGSGSGQVSINSVKSQIDPKASSHTVHIVSPGGDVFEGYGIYNILKNTGKKVTTQIEGLCASIATLIAFAGDEIIMNKISEFMIHNPSISDLKGDATQIRNIAAQLDMIKSLLIDVSGQRAQRNGKAISKEELWKLYDNETWLTAQQALDMGFVDDVQDSIKAVARVDSTKFKNDMEENSFSKLLSAFKRMFKAEAFKNDVSDTLDDGRVVIVLSDAPDWTGAQIVLETGEPLPSGDYTLASGKTVTVDDNSTITAVSEAAAQNVEDMEANNKIKELEAQLAEAKALADKATAQAVSAKSDNAKFEARFKALEAKLKEDEKKTVGDTSEPGRGPVFKNIDNPAMDYDPMGEEAKKYFQSVNRLN